MKRNDPYTRIQRQPLWTLSITIPLLALSVIFEIVNPRNNLIIKMFFLVPIVILLFVGVFAFFRYRTNLKRLEQRRERALQGDRSLVAVVQPLSDPYILPIPTTIKLEQPRRAIVILGLVIALVLFIPFVIGLVFGTAQSHSSSGNHVLLTVLIILIGAVVALLLALLLIFYLIRNQLNFTIVADEQGLSSTYHGITATIRWSDARLFAVLNPDKPSNMRFYELSNEDTMVRWVNMPERAIFQRKENTVNAEYRRKVQALLSFIAARTGLLLYDLSPLSDSSKGVRQ